MLRRKAQLEGMIFPSAVQSRTCLNHVRTAEARTIQKAMKKNPQISPLRYASVETTNLLSNELISGRTPILATNLSSRS
jgi:hypothetical protein